MPEQAILVVGLILGIFLVTGLVIVFFMPKGKQAEVMAAANEPFELECVPADGKRYNLYARYKLTWKEGGRRGYGLVFDLVVRVDGEVTYDKKLGIGRDTPVSNDYVSNAEYFTSSGRSSDGYHRTATMKILDLGPRQPHTQILVTGKVIPVHDTSARPTKLYIAR